MGDEEGLEAVLSCSSHCNLRGVGWCSILQEQNTSSQLSSSFLHTSPDAAALVLLYNMHVFNVTFPKIIHHDNALAIPKDRGHHRPG